MGKRGYQEVRSRAGEVTGYRYQYTHPVTGDRESFSAKTLAECERHRQKMELARAELRAGAAPAGVAQYLPGGVDPSRAHVRDVWARYVAGLERSTRDRAELVWRTTIDVNLADGVTLGAQWVGALDQSTMRAWVVRLRETGGRRGKGRAWKTIRTAYDLLAAAFRAARLDRPWDPWRPCAGRAPVRQRREYVRSLDEAVALLRAARAEDERHWLRGRLGDLACRVAVGILCGVRNAELAGLSWDAIELDTGRPRMRIERQATRAWRRKEGGTRPEAQPKGSRGSDARRAQLLHADAAEALRAQRAQLQRLGLYRPDGPVFPSRVGGEATWRSGQGIRPSTLRRLVERAGLRGPLEAWCPHSLRHSMASLEAAAAPGNLEAVAARTGHRSREALMGYVHDLGVGVPASGIGRVGLAALPALTAPTEGETHPLAIQTRERPFLESDPWGLEPEPPDLGRTWEEKVAVASAAERRAKRARKALESRPLAEIAEEYVRARARGELPRSANGKPLPRPKMITDLSRKNATAAFNRAKNAGKSPEEARRAYHAAKRSTLSRWTRAVRIAGGGEG